MRSPFLLSLLILLLFSLPAQAQKPLPNIEVKDYNGKIIISWINEYKRKARVVSIQRSSDSIRDFTTIATVLNPENIDNGFLDKKPPAGKLFYRVFVAFPGGSYAYSVTRRPVKSEMVSELSPGDSIALNAPKNPAPKRVRNVFLVRDNNLKIRLPDISSKKYSIRFYDDKESLLFEIGKLTEPELIIEKVNFVHSGWFRYELMEDGKLVERDRFFIPADDKLRQTEQSEQGRKNKP
ncbi:MAG: hypothetical protein IPI66_15650 [Chitinophagaceae bacterium]|nr:hypothetical protein [Chitinophagaceae bacterium]